MYGAIGVPAGLTSPQRRRRICEILDVARTTYQLTREDCAHFYGVSPTMWSKIETGVRAFDFDRLSGFPVEFRQWMTAAVAEQEGLHIVPTQDQLDIVAQEVAVAFGKFMTLYTRRKNRREEDANGDRRSA